MLYKSKAKIEHFFLFFFAFGLYNIFQLELHGVFWSNRDVECYFERSE